MDVLFSLGRRGLSQTKQMRADLTGGTLGSLFDSLSKNHPDLAPLLEDATNQPDLEIYVNDRPVRREQGATFPLHDGDVVSLFVRDP